MAGGAIDAYTESEYVSDGDLDLDHRVARYEAHISGLCSKTAEDRDAFSRDPANLALSHWYVNRNVKKAYDAAMWLPPKNKCEFALRCYSDKAKHGLTVDRAEARALDRALKECNP